MPGLTIVGGEPSKAEGRTACDDEQPAQSCQIGDKFIRQRIGYEGEVARISHHAEGQDGNRRPILIQSDRGFDWIIHRCRDERMRVGARKFYLANKAEPLAVHSSHQSLLTAIISQSLARGFDPRRDSRLRNDAVIPDLLDNFVLADQPVRVRRQQQKQRQDLWLRRDGHPGLAQFKACRVQFEILEPVDHRVAPR